MDFKRGDTWRWTGPLDFTPSNPPTIDGWTIQSQGRKPDGTLIQTFTVEILDPVNRIVQHYASGTATQAWPIGPMDLDIQCTDASGDIVSTQTTRINILGDITHA